MLLEKIHLGKHTFDLHRSVCRISRLLGREQSQREEKTATFQAKASLHCLSLFHLPSISLILIFFLLSSLLPAHHKRTSDDSVSPSSSQIILLSIPSNPFSCLHHPDEIGPFISGCFFTVYQLISERFE